MAGVIEVSGLTKYYGKKRGVIDLSFEVREGRGLRLPRTQRRGQDDDDPAVDGAAFPWQRPRVNRADSTAGANRFEVKRLVGYLPGELALDPNLTGGQILTYFANLRGGVDRSISRAAASRGSTSTPAGGSGTTRTATSRRWD